MQAFLGSGIYPMEMRRIRKEIKRGCMAARKMDKKKHMWVCLLGELHCSKSLRLDHGESAPTQRNKTGTRLSLLQNVTGVGGVDFAACLNSTWTDAVPRSRIDTQHTVAHNIP